MNFKHKLSIVIPVSERFSADIEELHYSYKSQIASVTDDCEFIYILDGVFENVFEQLKGLINKSEPIKVVSLSRRFGEAAALSAGFEHCNGEYVMTLPAYSQVELNNLSTMFDEIKNSQIIIVRRWPRIDPWVNRIQAKLFSVIQRYITKNNFRDLGCSVRLMTCEVAKELKIYGDQHRFLPVIAELNGFKVKEIDFPQAKNDDDLRLYSPGVYLRRLLDIATVFFLAKFTKKPLRFFGLVGTASFVVGAFYFSYIAIERLFLDKSLADRPALLFATMLIVLGIQLFALGLIGELIIFTQSKSNKEYRVEKIVNK